MKKEDDMEAYYCKRCNKNSVNEVCSFGSVDEVSAALKCTSCHSRVPFFYIKDIGIDNAIKIFNGEKIPMVLEQAAGLYNAELSLHTENIKRASSLTLNYHVDQPVSFACGCGGKIVLAADKYRCNHCKKTVFYSYYNIVLTTEQVLKLFSDNKLYVFDVINPEHEEKGEYALVLHIDEDYTRNQYFSNQKILKDLLKKDREDLLNKSHISS